MDPVVDQRGLNLHLVSDPENRNLVDEVSSKAAALSAAENQRRCRRLVKFPQVKIPQRWQISNFKRGSTRVDSCETTVAEQFIAMVKLGLLNSRLKDSYDIWLMSRQLGFDGPSLATALEKTFAHCGTLMTAEPKAVSQAFTTDPSKVT
jgi:hypothetical protein